MIIIAFFMGLIFSIPIGPLGIIMLKRSREEGFWAGFSIVIIDSIAVFIFSLSFLIGIGQIDFDPTIKLIAQVLGLIILLIIGIKEIFKKDKNQQKELALNSNMIFGNLLLVAGYYISNPTVWVFWINLSVYAKSNTFYQNNLLNNILFSFLFALGGMTTQYISIFLLKNVERFEKVKHKLKYISSGLFILTLGYFFYIALQKF